MIEAITSMTGAFSLTGKNAVITGGNRGIGWGISLAMAQSGANVAILCRDQNKAAEALAELKQYGGKYASFFCDVTDLISVRKAVAQVCEEFGGIDILVNNSGVATNTAFLDMDEEMSDWYRVLDTDLNGVAHVTYEAGKRMRDAQKGGSIINIASVSGISVHRGSPRTPYNASKAGVIHFTHSMALELGQYNIRVNAIAPGYIRAGFTDKAGPGFLAKVASEQALDRMGEAIEVGAMAVYLASPAAAHVTGTVQVLDGGNVISC